MAAYGCGKRPLITHPFPLPSHCTHTAVAITTYQSKYGIIGHVYNLIEMAAQLAGMDRVPFLLSLHRYGVAMIDLDEEELLKECTMDNIVLEIPKESALGLRVPVGEAGNIVRMAAAVKLFEMGQLSSGAAARLAGVPRVIFLSSLADYGVDTFRLTETQLAQETRLA